MGLGFSNEPWLPDHTQGFPAKASFHIVVITSKFLFALNYNKYLTTRCFYKVCFRNSSHNATGHPEINKQKLYLKKSLEF